MVSVSIGRVSVNILEVAAADAGVALWTYIKFGKCTQAWPISSY